MTVAFAAILLAGWSWRGLDSRDQTERNKAAGFRSEPLRMEARPDSAIPATPLVETMTNEDVLALRRAGVSDAVIVVKMGSVHCLFRLGTSDIVVLKRAGASDPMISAMMQAMRSR
jgi:hypothetical protein